MCAKPSQVESRVLGGCSFINEAFSDYHLSPSPLPSCPIRPSPPHSGWLLFCLPWLPTFYVCLPQIDLTHLWLSFPMLIDCLCFSTILKRVFRDAPVHPVQTDRKLEALKVHPRMASQLLAAPLWGTVQVPHVPCWFPCCGIYLSFPLPPPSFSNCVPWVSDHFCVTSLDPLCPSPDI